MFLTVGRVKSLTVEDLVPVYAGDCATHQSILSVQTSVLKLCRAGVCEEPWVMEASRATVLSPLDEYSLFFRLKMPFSIYS